MKTKTRLQTVIDLQNDEWHEDETFFKRGQQWKRAKWSSVLQKNICCDYEVNLTQPVNL